MSKFAVLLGMAATWTVGCQNTAPMEMIAPQEPAIMKPKQGDWVGTVARISQKDSFAEPAPLNQNWTAVPKTDRAEKPPAPATPPVVIVAGKLKPAEAAKKVLVEKALPAKPSENVSLPGIPRDVWYAIATIFGAVFTSLLAPIAVEIIRERIAARRHQVAAIQASATSMGRPTEQAW